MTHTPGVESVASAAAPQPETSKKKKQKDLCNALISSMGNAEGKPLDASDITDLEAAKAEVKYREGLAPIQLLANVHRKPKKNFTQ